MNEQSNDIKQDDSTVSHDRFMSIMDEPGKGVRLDTAKCLGFLSDGTLGRIPFIIYSFAGWLFHLVCWVTLVYLFMKSWIYGPVGIVGYLVLFFVKTVMIEHWFAVNLTLARAKNDPDFYHQLRTNDIIETPTNS